MSKDAHAATPASHVPAEPGSAERIGSGSPARSPHPEAMCVMWASTPPPRDLMASLAQRGVRSRRCAGPYTAVTQACARRRMFPEAPCVFLFVEPRGLHDPAGVVAALRRYAPRTRIWVFERGSENELRALRPEDMDSWNPVPANIASPALRSAVSQDLNASGAGSLNPAIVGGGGSWHQPRLRLIGEAGVQGPLSASDTTERVAVLPEEGVDVPEPASEALPADSSAALTGEELSMLLGRTPHDGASSH